VFGFNAMRRATLKGQRFSKDSDFVISDSTEGAAEKQRIVNVS